MLFRSSQRSAYFLINAPRFRRTESRGKPPSEDSNLASTGGIGHAAPEDSAGFERVRASRVKVCHACLFGVLSFVGVVSELEKSDAIPNSADSDLVVGESVERESLEVSSESTEVSWPALFFGDGVPLWNTSRGIKMSKSAPVTQVIAIPGHCIRRHVHGASRQQHESLTFSKHSWGIKFASMSDVNQGMDQSGYEPIKHLWLLFIILDVVIPVCEVREHKIFQ